MPIVPPARKTVARQVVIAMGKRITTMTAGDIKLIKLVNASPDLLDHIYAIIRARNGGDAGAIDGAIYNAEAFLKSHNL